MSRYLIIVLSVAALLLNACASTGSVVYRPGLVKLTENRIATYRIDTLPTGHGSGVVVSSDGYIVTCAHVADAGVIVRITVRDGNAKPENLMANVIAVDETTDLALLKVDHRFAHPVVIADQDEPRVGDDVYNVGFPYNFGELIGRGYIMGLNFNKDDIDIKDATVVDIPDGSGTSGSGVFLGRNGHLMGIMDMVIAIRQTRNLVPMVIRLLINVKNVRAFLEAHHVAYLTPKGVRTYPPPPVHAHPAPRPAAPAHPSHAH